MLLTLRLCSLSGTALGSFPSTSESEQFPVGPIWCSSAFSALPALPPPGESKQWPSPEPPYSSPIGSGTFGHGRQHWERSHTPSTSPTESLDGASPLSPKPLTRLRWRLHSFWFSPRPFRSLVRSDFTGWSSCLRLNWHLGYAMDRNPVRASRELSTRLLIKPRESARGSRPNAWGKARDGQGSHPCSGFVRSPPPLPSH